MPLDLTGVRLLSEEVTTPRLLLRPWRAYDAADIVRACNDPRMARWLPVPAPYSDRDAQDYLADSAVESRNAGTGMTCAMVERDGGRLVGAISIDDLAEAGGAVFGYWVAAWARGRGYAGEATRALSDWAFGHGVHRVWLLAAVGNRPSQRAAERAGMRREGVLRGARWDREGVPLDMVLYARLATDPATPPTG